MSGETNRQRHYSYVVFTENIARVAESCTRLLLDAKLQTYNFLSGNFINLLRRTIWFGAPGGTQTCLWYDHCDTRLFQRVLKELDCTCHWIHVNEDLKAYAYARFDRSGTKDLYLEPEKLWRSCVVSGDDLDPEKNRRVRSERHFLEEIDFQPPVREGTYGTLRADAERELCLMGDDMSGLVKVEVDRDGLTGPPQFFGEWTKTDRQSVVESVGAFRHDSSG